VNGTPKAGRQSSSKSSGSRSRTFAFTRGQLFAHNSTCKCLVILRKLSVYLHEMETNIPGLYIQGNLMRSQQLENASVRDIGRLGVPVALFAFDENCDTGMQLSDLRLFVTLEHRPLEVSRRQGAVDDGEIPRDDPSIISLRTFRLNEAEETVMTSSSTTTATATNVHPSIYDLGSEPAGLVAVIIVPVVAVLLGGLRASCVNLSRDLQVLKS